MSSKRVLIADENPTIRRQLSQELIAWGHQVRATSSPATVLKWLDHEPADLAILEAGGDGWADRVADIRRAHPTLPIILTSPAVTLALSVRAVMLGAIELLLKPVRNEPLRAAMETAFNRRADRDAAKAQARAVRDEKLAILGAAEPMQRVYRALARLAEPGLPVLIWGETGVGKTVAAKALHDFGPRREARFVPLHLAGRSEATLERELLGQDGRSGKFAAAAGGVLLLDGLDDLGWTAQGLLLSLLDEAIRLSRGASAGVRLVSTAKQDLRQAVGDGRFREDLYFRLAGAEVRMPPLRERREDIPELARTLLARAARDGLPSKQIDAEAARRLQAHAWPGNVIELNNVMRRLCVLHAEELITTAVVAREMAEPEAARDRVSLAALSQFVESRVATHMARRPREASPAPLHDAVVAAVETQLLQVALSATQGDPRQAANLLGVSRGAFTRKLEDLGLAASGAAIGTGEVANDLAGRGHAAAALAL